MLTKPKWRRRMRAMLQSVPAADLAAGSEAIARQFLALPEVAAAATVFTYVSTPGEIETHCLIDQLLHGGKIVAVPLIVGPRVMEAHRIECLSDCAPGAFGLPAPRKPRPLESPPEVCVTPGLACTPEGGRLGRGGGYYDVYLAAHPHVLAVAFALDVQIVEHLPMGPTDRHVHAIITPTRVIRCARVGASDSPG